MSQPSLKGQNNRFLVVISAPSGAGKTTLCERLLKDYPSDLCLSISTTTRSPRGAEQNGREYIFVSRPEFEERIQQGLFAEWALVHGNYYGTSKETIHRAFESGKSVLLDIDVQGAESFRKAFPENCVDVFISPPSLADLEARLRNRKTETEAVIQTRVKNAETEMKCQGDFKYCVVNDDLDRAYGELLSIVRKYLGTPLRERA
jgi:guanylate kinase